MSTVHQVKIVIKGDLHIYGVMPEHASALPYMEDEVLGEILRQKPEITYNTNRTHANGKKAPDGIELRFGAARPTEGTRQLLHDHGYRFSERQTIWYAIDNAKSRGLVEFLTNNDIEIDTTRYVKHSFWAKVKNSGEYGRLRDRTEFWVKIQPPKYFYNKRYLERGFNVGELIAEGHLYFKKYYNKVVGEEEFDEDEPDTSDNTDNADTENENDGVSEKLKALADGMQKEIDEKINSATSRQRPTARRLRIADGMRKDGYRLKAIQTLLYALAAAHKSGEIKEYPLLSLVRGKKEVRLLNNYTTDTLRIQNEQEWKEFFSRNQHALERIGIRTLEQWKDAEVQKSAIISRHHPSPVEEQLEAYKQQIKDLERQAYKEQIPGFFPTPRPLIDRMLELAEVKLNHRILDPSAGKGDILDAIAKLFPGRVPHLFAVEVNNTLRKILDLKGYTPIGRDFLEVQERSFDRIIMNPPFENGQNADHVTHAMKLLRSGGRLVAIVGEGLFFRQYKKEKAFRELLVRKNAYVSEPIKEAFRDGFNSTGVNVRIIAMNEDASPFDLPSAQWQRATIDQSPIEDNTNEMELLELEAEAELELLKMRVENERRKRQQGVNGITVNEEKLRQFKQKAWAMNNADVLDFN